MTTALTRKEKTATREQIKALASQHSSDAIKRLNEIATDRNAPANARIAALNSLLDRSCGKPRFTDQDKEDERSQLDKLSAPELMEFITQQFSGLPLSARAVLGESLDKGLAFDAADIMDVIEEPKGLPPLTPAPKPKREPRR